MDDFWFDNASDFKMSDVSSNTGGIDSFLGQDGPYDPSERTSSSSLDDKIASSKGESCRIKVSSPDQLDGFHRISGSDKLIRMSEKDLWALEEEEDGEYAIERLFDEDGDPLEV
jgi:hypothetical protein